MESELATWPLHSFPSLGYMATFVVSGAELSLAERFEKQSFRSRYEIAGPNGRQRLSIPLQHQTTHGSFAEVKIDYSQNWTTNHWRSLEAAYRKSAFFEFYAHHFEAMFQKRYHLLAEFNIEALCRILKILKMTSPIALNTTAPFSHQLGPYNESLDTGYNQVFIGKLGFLKNLSVLDLIFNQGPEALDYLKRLSKT